MYCTQLIETEMVPFWPPASFQQTEMRPTRSRNFWRKTGHQRTKIEPFLASSLYQVSADKSATSSQINGPDSLAGASRPQMYTAQYFPTLHHIDARKLKMGDYLALEV